MMSQAPFIHINKVGGQQGGPGPGPGAGPRIPPPPPHPPGGQGGPRAPQVINVNPGPNGNHHQGGGPHQQHFVPPPPHKDMVPLHLQQPPLVQISDLRRERMTEAEAREELAEYIIVRIEKVEESPGYTDEGEARKSTWEQVVRREVRDISKAEAIRQIQHLSRGRSLSEKKGKLNPAQQSQLERAQEDLQRREQDQRFQIKLFQLDHQTRPKREWYYGDRYYDRHYHRGSGWGWGSGSDKAYRKGWSSSYRHSHGSVADFKAPRRPSLSRDGKPLKETVSITAYYKRSLKPELNGLVTLMQRDAEMQRRLQPPNPQHVLPPQQQMQQHQQGPPPQGPNHSHPGGPLPKNAVMGPRPPAQIVGGKKDDKLVEKKQHPGQGRRRPSGSESSSEMDVTSESEEDSLATPNSNTSSRRGRRRSTSKGRPGAGRKERRFFDGPRHYGVAAGLPPHKARQHSQHHISDEFLPGAPLPPQAPPLAALGLPRLASVNIEQIKAEAYAQGRADEMLDTRDHVERVTELALTRNPPPAPPPPGPVLLQRQPSVRLVHPGDVSPRLEEAALERLERFHLDDGRYDRRHDDALFYETRRDPGYSGSFIDALPSRVSPYARDPRRREELSEWEDDDGYPEGGVRRVPAYYPRRRDSAPGAHFYDGSPSTFHPQFELRRRATANSPYYNP